MADIRAFRGFRYDMGKVGSLSDVVAPPYDVIDAALQQTLYDLSPYNAIRVELSKEEVGDTESNNKYTRAASTLNQWQNENALTQDTARSMYVYEQEFTVEGKTYTRRGFFARVRLEPFGTGCIHPHEQTLSGPKQDRLNLYRATNFNLSPVFGLYPDDDGEVFAKIEPLIRKAPPQVANDHLGVTNRLWVITDQHTISAVIGFMGPKPVFIADGHHRYETALRYRDERRANHTGEQDPSYDFILMLFLDAADALTVLPTHRVVRGLGEAGMAGLHAGLSRLFAVTQTTADALAERFEAAGGLDGGEGRFGLLTRDGAWLLDARREAFAGLGSAGAAVRALDVSLLAAALDALLGIDAGAVADGRRIAYTKSVAEATALIADGTDGADACFLLEPTPVASIVAVARDGDVMPPKSTYFYPKALTGLVLNPHEW